MRQTLIAITLIISPLFASAQWWSTNIYTNGLYLGRYGSALSGDSNPYDIYTNDNETHDLIIFGGSAATLHLRLYDGDLKFGDSATPNSILYNNGNANFGGSVGIGTVSPYSNSRLHIKSPSVSDWGFVSEALNNQKIIGIGHDGTAGVVSVSYLDGSGYSPLYLKTSNSTRVAVTVDGNVGIGTITPDSKLTVKGTIHSQEVKVDLNGSVAPDYVFEKDYALTSLEELKSYIEQNKHLPEIPSAKKMEEEGIDLKEMNLLLLKKVEELTLHIIKLNDKNANQEIINLELINEINILKKNKN